MVLPGFTAEVASFGGFKKDYYHYSSMKRNTSVRQEITSYGMNTSRSSIFHHASAYQRKTIPEPQKEPSESGRRAWNALEKACDNLQCEECRNDCIKFINGLHDAINIKLGKPMRSPTDFVYLKDFVNEMSKHIS